MEPFDSYDEFEISEKESKIAKVKEVISEDNLTERAKETAEVVKKTKTTRKRTVKVEDKEPVEE